jgi:Transposase
MPNGMRWVGLDVHAHASTLAVFDDVTGEVVTRRVNGRPIEALDALRGVPHPMRAVYEAGPTGYGLVRRARAEGLEMAVCSPGNIERRPGDRVKTDKRDAIRLARLFAAGDLRLVWVPSEEQEQLRDLVRCREDLRADLMRARLRLAAFLLRRERYFPGPGERWTLRHRHWLSQQRFDDARSRVTYADSLHAHDVLVRAPRVGRPRARADRAGLRLGPDDRPVALFARQQHADRARTVRGDRRLEALRASRLDRQDASGWSRPSTAPARPAGWARSPRPAAPTRAGCWSRPRCTTASRRRSAASSRSANAATTQP